jgi:hypothetical protein
MREAQLSISGATWRQHPFESGRTYVAAQSFHGCPFLGFSEPEFIAGRAYQLVHIGHSHYDECTIFVFREREGTQNINWWWSDKESESECGLKFRIS